MEYVAIAAVPAATSMLLYYLQSRDLWAPRDITPNAWELRVLSGPMLALFFPLSEITASSSRDDVIRLAVLPRGVGLLLILALGAILINTKFDEGRLPFTLSGYRTTRGLAITLAGVGLMGLEAGFALAVRATS